MIVFGAITHGSILELDHPELYSDLLKGGLANCRVQLEIDRKKTPRSQQQNAYLWAAVCILSSLSTREIPSQKFTKCKPDLEVIQTRMLSRQRSHDGYEAALARVRARQSAMEKQAGDLDGWLAENVEHEEAN
jgi:hypothetical protein